MLRRKVNPKARRTHRLYRSKKIPESITSERGDRLELFLQNCYSFDELDGYFNGELDKHPQERDSRWQSGVRDQMSDVIDQRLTNPSFSRHSFDELN